LEALFGFSPLTERDATARNLLSLLSLPNPRTDTAIAMPTPSARSALLAAAPSPMAEVGKAPLAVSRAGDSINGGMLPATVHAALRQELQMTPDRKPQVLAEVAALQTRADAMRYLAEVQTKLRARGA
jgi:phospholipase C